MKKQRSNQSSSRQTSGDALRVASMTLVLLLFGLSLHSQAAKKKAKPAEIRWRVTVEGKQAGVETLKRVDSSSGRVFASGTVEPKGKSAIQTITHQQRDPGGIFKKYRREEKARLGKGVFAFRKNKSADRLVGLNQKLEPLELAPIGEGPVWDRVAWHTLALWSAHLQGDGRIEMAYLDIAERTRKQAVATPASEREITTPEKERVGLRVWTLKGLMPSAITTAWHPKRGLIFASDGARELMREGFSWEPPPPPEPPATPEADTAGGAPEEKSSPDGAAVPGGPAPSKPESEKVTEEAEGDRS